MQLLILTGGQGTRLRPLTLSTPKPLLPVVNRPFLSYPIALARKHGVRDVVLCAAGSKKPYRELIRSEKRVGSHLDCSMEKEELGTAGAMKNAEKLISEFPVFVFNGDVLTDMDLSGMLRFHRRVQAKATLALVEVPDPSAFGLVKLDADGKVKKFVEKPSPHSLSPLKKGGDIRGGKPFWINAGIYLLEKEIFDLIPKGEKCSIERSIFPLCLARKVPLYGYRLSRSTFWLDVGTPEKYLKANQTILARGAKRFGIEGQLQWVDKKSKIGLKSLIGRNVVVGKGCKIGKECKIENSLLLENVKVEDFVEMANCIVDSGARIGHHSKIKGMAVIGNGSALTPFSRVG